LAALFLAQRTFEDVLSPDRETVQEWIDALHQAVGDEAFTSLQKDIELRAVPILQQALHAEANSG
jgi:hypothetical protein